MFGRAALLGYNARGDPRSCTTAYPTCPRDPDQLINYLNNHNGGFFRFFNQQLPQYAPQYASHQQQQPPYQQPPYQQPPYQRPPYGRPPAQQPLYQRPPYQQQQPSYPQEQYAAQYQRPQQSFGGNVFRARTERSFDEQQKPRILHGSPSQYYDLPSVHDLALDLPTRNPPMVFPSEPTADHSGASSNHVSPFVFPSDGNRRAKKKMIFPDRTGTGGLRAELDKYGNYKGVYYADGAIKFDDGHRDGAGRPTRIRLPDSTSSSDRPADEFQVGNRMPYERRQKLHFPRTS